MSAVIPPLPLGQGLVTVELTPRRRTTWMKQWRNPRLPGLFASDFARSIRASSVNSTAFAQAMDVPGGEAIGVFVAFMGRGVLMQCSFLFKERFRDRQL